jgi:hypothetical protein
MATRGSMIADKGLEGTGFASDAELGEWLEFLEWLDDPGADPTNYAIVNGSWIKIPRTAAAAARRLHPGPSILTLSAVAEHFGLTSKTVINVLVRERGLRGLHLGREWRFRSDDVRAFEQEQFTAHGRRSS